jgi:hypothetical protein
MLDLDVFDYVDRLQRATYRASQGKVLPRECLLLTLPEIIIILEEGTELNQEILILHADMKTATLNAPHFYQRNQKPYEIKQFLPKPLARKLKQDLRPEDQARLIQERGDALAAKCKQYTHRR